MKDRLQSAIDNLLESVTPPLCDDCGKLMLWYECGPSSNIRECYCESCNVNEYGEVTEVLML